MMHYNKTNQSLSSKPQLWDFSITRSSGELAGLISPSSQITDGIILADITG